MKLSFHMEKAYSHTYKSTVLCLAKKTLETGMKYITLNEILTDISVVTSSFVKNIAEAIVKGYQKETNRCNKFIHDI